MPPASQPTETTRVYMRRLSQKHRHIPVSRKQIERHLPPLEKKSDKGKEALRVLTPEERKERAERAKDRQDYIKRKLAEAQSQVWEIAKDLMANLGRTTEHWHQCLMQVARIEQSERMTSSWNAFVSIRLKEINSGQLSGASTYIMNLPYSLP